MGSHIWEVWPAPAEREKIIRELEARRLEYEVLDDLIQVFHLDDKAGELPGRPRPATLEDVFFKLTGRMLVE
ncbi:MAG: hypothetical protein ABID71_04460 [Chloroflexota bacterium]